jgi:hypothetical protein
MVRTARYKVRGLGTSYSNKSCRWCKRRISISSPSKYCCEDHRILYEKDNKIKRDNNKLTTEELYEFLDRVE